jgi:hypothetical protein
MITSVTGQNAPTFYQNANIFFQNKNYLPKRPIIFCQKGTFNKKNDAQTCDVL